MNSFDLDGRSIPFEEGDNILKAALAAGVAIPYFCYHDALGSLGACRLCAVEIEDGRKGPRVVMSCMEPACSGLRVSLHAERAVRARQGVIEFLMTNHPHDCPICDEGGECHLQDMTVACGPAYRRYRGRKRTFPNQDLGPLVHHEMNRCITCYRCTRFYREYALGTDLGAMRLRNEVYFGRFADGPLESPFAGNLVEICPTGVFTDKVFRRTFARVWDLETAPSICPHCSVGCNTLPGARHGTLRRVRNRFHAEINRWFLCDRGRYGHAYTEHSERPLIPRLNGHPVEYRQAVRAAARCIRKAGGGLGVLASCREDLECLAAMKEFAERTGALFAAFVDPSLEGAVTAVGQAMEKRRPPSLAGIEQSDAVLVAGDLTAHAPMMDLAVRQAVRNKATLALLHSTPIPATAYCSLHALAPPAEVPEWLDRLRIHLRSRKISSRGMEGKIAAALIRARRPLLVGVAETLGIAGVKAMAALAEILGERGELALALPGPNAFGAAMFTTSGGAEALLAALEAGNVRTLLVASQDPFGTGPLARRWRQACEGLDDLIVLDCIKTATLRAASIQIPVAAWTERTGIFVNYEILCSKSSMS
jgi:NADH-quinone oxidoreductase, chain G